ncbi:unnamed protein product [Taenia asiatica]|uniref:Uncharacterized protein n=1 Tax=Taenia asiatica TaxID=60517 RepID=A0A158R8S7_TAEAS|nr:unnamed protein product [Taenia asiatica]
MTPYEYGMYQALSVRLIQRILTLHHGMTFTRVPLEPFPSLSLEVLHSRDFFSYTGPLLIVVQGCNESALGVWEPTHLAEEVSESPSRNLKTGSQIEFVKLAHNRGYRVAFLNLHCLAAETSVPLAAYSLREEYSMRTDTTYLNCDIFPSRGASQSQSGPSDRFSALVYLQRSPAFVCDATLVTQHERMACGWEALLARCCSSNIVVWVHRRAEESFLYPLCPIPQPRTRQPSTPKARVNSCDDSSSLTHEPGPVTQPPGSQQSQGGASPPPHAGAYKRKVMVAWCERARAYWSTLRSRVRAVAFVDPCQMITDFLQSGVGWGLANPDKTPSAQILLQRDISLVRKWFAEEFTAVLIDKTSICITGTHLGDTKPPAEGITCVRHFSEAPQNTDIVSSLNGRTKENDLIHAYVMTTVLNFFDQKLHRSAAPGGSQPLSL